MSQIAAQLYTLREFLKTPEDIKETFKKVRDIGYEAVQLSGLGPIEPQALKEIADETGLAICCTHTSFQRMQDDLDALVEEHKLWGSKYMGIGAMPPEARASKEALLDFIKTIKVVGKNIHNKGLTFTYHNHRFEMEKFGTKTMMDILLEETTKEEVSFLVDTYWLMAGGVDPIKFITDHSDRIDVIHLKDLKVVNDQITMAAVGEGNMNFPAIIEAAKKANVEWYAIEQDTCDRDPFDCLKSSFNYVKSLGLS